MRSLLPAGFHITTAELDALVDMDDLPADLAHWSDDPDLSQDPLANEREAFDQDAYYDGFGDP